MEITILILQQHRHAESANPCLLICLYLSLLLICFCGAYYSAQGQN